MIHVIYATYLYILELFGFVHVQLFAIVDIFWNEYLYSVAAVDALKKFVTWNVF